LPFVLPEAGNPQVPGQLDHIIVAMRRLRVEVVRVYFVEFSSRVETCRASLHSAGTSSARFDMKRSAYLNATTAGLRSRLGQIYAGFQTGRRALKASVD
jgi:hypothetical protein